MVMPQWFAFFLTCPAHQAGTVRMDCHYHFEQIDSFTNCPLHQTNVAQMVIFCMIQSLHVFQVKKKKKNPKIIYIVPSIQWESTLEKSLSFFALMQLEKLIKHCVWTQCLSSISTKGKMKRQSVHCNHMKMLIYEVIYL